MDACRVDDLHLAFVAVMEVVKEHAHRWDPRMKERWNVAHAAPREGAGAVISAWTANQCNKALR